MYNPNSFNSLVYAPLASPVLTGNPTAPTAPLNDEDLSVANTSFVQQNGIRFRGAGSGITSSRTLTLSELGGFIEVQNPGLTVTLPPLSSTSPGQTYCLKALNAFTIVTSGIDTISPPSGAQVSTISVSKGETFTITANSPVDSWYITLGLTSYSSPALFSNNGYQKLPSGIIIQWGYITGTEQSDGYTTTINYPITFPNAAFAVSCTGAPACMVGSTSVTNSGFSVAIYNRIVFDNIVSFVEWIAVGY